MDEPVTDEPVDEPAPRESATVPTVVVAAVETAAADTTAPPGELPSFRQLENDNLARIVLLQTDPVHFQLVEGFRYQGAAGSWTVTPDDLPDTDLASIPPFLSWFTSRYGAHTLAALLHDHLVRNGETLTPAVQRSAADDVFRTALDELDVPYVRARIMWTAVTLATRWRASLAARAAVIVWMIAATFGIVGLVWGVLTLNLPLVAVAVLAPIPAALLWGRRHYVAGLFGGYTLWLIAVPALVNIAAYNLYNGAERLVRWYRKRLPANREKVMPGPPPYKAL